MKTLLRTVFLIVLILQGCRKKEQIDPSKFPTTLAELQASFQITKEISSHALQIIDDKLDLGTVNNSAFNIQEIVNEVKKINGVKNANLNASRSSIIVEQNDGVFTNLLIANKADSRQFKLTQNNFVSQRVNSFIDDPSNYHLTTIPQHISTLGHKAVLICPFQHDFNENIPALTSILQSLGYAVDYYKDDQATIDRFKGDFLKQYDIIYISTHADAKGVNLEGKTITSITTGEAYDPNRYSDLIPEIRHGIGHGTVDKKSGTFFCIDADYIKATLTGKFPNSWVFVNACQSSKEKDLSGIFLNNGAIAYNGFNDDMNVYLANAIGGKMITLFASGYEFSTAYKLIMDDAALGKFNYYSSTTNKNSNLSLFSSQINTDQKFYLRDNIFGEIIINPSSARVGQKITVGIHIWSKYVFDYQKYIFTSNEGSFYLSIPAGGPPDTPNFTYQYNDNISIAQAKDGNYPVIDYFTFEGFDVKTKPLGSCFYSLIVTSR